MKFYIHLFLICFFTLWGCKDGFYFNKNSKDPILARVGEKVLFRSEVQSLVTKGTSAVDSAAIVDGYMENWIRERLMIVEADKNVAADINLTKLVEDYKSSLLVYNFEKKLIDTQLDTIILLADRQSYYDENKSQYILSHPIFQCIIAKIPYDKKDVQIIEKALQKSDLTEAVFLIKEKAVYHHLKTENYMTLQDLKSLLPNNILKEKPLSKNKVFHEKEKEFEYFVKILQYYDENTIPPFEYIESKIVKNILSERKIQLLKNYRQQLYEKGRANKDFEIYKPD